MIWTKSLYLSIVCSTAASLALQADLTPPPGTPQATMKTLDEVEPRIPISELPFTIEESGSYYLTGDLTGVEGEHGILFAGNPADVFIDLQGHTISGVAGSSNGVFHDDPNGSAPERLVIRNGVIRGFDGDGVFLRGGMQDVVVEDLAIVHNGRDGVYLEGSSVRSRVKRSMISHNGRDGLRSGRQGMLLKDSTISGNERYSAFVNWGGLIDGCVFEENGAGVAGARGVVVRNSLVLKNSGTGLSLGNDCLVGGCMVMGNDGDGIIIGVGSAVEQSTVNENGGNGIRVVLPGGVGDDPPGSWAEIRDSRVVGNQLDGIVVAGEKTRISGNHVVENRRGVVIADSGNWVVSNFASGNTEGNYEIADGNEVGPIGAMAEVGEHPWANFSIGEPEDQDGED